MRIILDRLFIALVIFPPPSAPALSSERRLQLEPFQRKSDRVGTCPDSMKRSIQFCRDEFGAGIRLCHPAKEFILFGGPPAAAVFNHASLFPLRLQPRLAHALKGFNVSAHEKSAIVKADRDPAIVAALDNFADLTLRRHFGFPGESLSDQPDPIANFETGPQLRFLLHFALAFSPSSTRRRMLESVQPGAIYKKRLNALIIEGSRKFG
jgi:hypothetical protein